MSKQFQLTAVGSAWSPLRHPLFRALWIAAVASNIGTWMQNVGAAWFMTDLTKSPLLIALLQAATSFPIFLVGYPAGAIADIFDRRLILLFTQSWMLLAATGLSILTALHITNAWLLLIFTFALGLGNAINLPVWQAIVPELVPRAELHAAIALNGVGVNLARAVGPALAGIAVAAVKPEGVFLLNAATFIGVIAVLYIWKRQPRKSALPAERLWGAMRSGIQYLRYAPNLQAVLVRSVIFTICGSAIWALLPALARYQLGLQSSGYGILLGSIGIGAVAGAFILPMLRRRLSLNALVLSATISYAIAMFVAAYLRNLGLVNLAMIAIGIGWIVILSSLNVAVQTSVPMWVQARSLGIFQLMFQGGMAIGSVLWGAVASHLSTSTALALSSGAMIVGLVIAIRFRLRSGDNLNLSPALHWAEPVVVIEPQAEEGPVLIKLEYQIKPEQAEDFIQAMQALGAMRQRDGAIRWGVWGDVAQPGHYTETFVVESWLEHLRQHERITVSDMQIEQRVNSFHIGKDPPFVSHLIYANSLLPRQRGKGSGERN